MTDSVFWRDLHDKFVAFQDRLRASSGATRLTYKQLEVLAKRGASEIARPGTPNLLSVWLEAVRKEDPDFRTSYLAKEVSSLAEFEQNFEIGTLDSMCQASATFCKKLEDQALQAEFNEKERNVAGTNTTAKAEPQSVKAKGYQAREVDHPDPGPVSRAKVVIPRPQLRNGSREDGPEPVMRQGKVEASANDLLGNSKDTIFSRAAGAVRETLLGEVTRLFKAVFKFHYESAAEVNQSPEWDGMNKLFCDAADTYVNIAMNNRRKIRGELFLWVKAQIEANESAILIQHFDSDRKGCLPSKETSQDILAEHRDQWKAQAHMGWMNQNSVFWVCQRHIVSAGSLALGNAAIRIAAGSTPAQDAQQSTSHSSVDSLAGLPFVRSSVLLSTFEATVGEMMVQARRECPTKYLPQSVILKVAALLDNKNLPVRENLEREAARTVAEYNQRHPASAIKSWKTALSHPQFRRAVRKRFSRAEEKYKKATPHVPTVSAGSPRTTI
jgi:hypothetical protein